MASSEDEKETRGRREMDLEEASEGEESSSGAQDQTRRKRRKAGIVYLSAIPPTMNVTMVRENFEKFGDVGRVFLQPANKGLKKRPSKTFTEGWVEFKSKRRAKMAAVTLNGQQVGGRKRHAYYDSTWSVKYLSGFKWVHLSERMAYERAVHQQRLRQEISQVKRETNFYSVAVDKSARLKRLNKNEGKVRNVQLREPIPS